MNVLVDLKPETIFEPKSGALTTDLSDGGRNFVLEIADTSKFKLWTLAVAAFADFVEPHGGCASVSCLSDLVGLYNVDTPVFRTTLSRMCDHGWLVRHKSGRNSFYELTDYTIAETRKKAEIVYRHQGATFSGRWRIVLVLGNAAKTNAIRSDLREDGFGEIREGVYVAPDKGSLPLSAKGEECFSFAVNIADPGDVDRLVSLGWDLSSIEKTYLRFAKRWDEIEKTVANGGKLDPIVTAGIRLLLIYEFRRCVLTHPPLPYNFGGESWIGVEARDIAARLWHRLLPSSEQWLMQCCRRHDGPMPEASPELYLRFKV